MKRKPAVVFAFAVATLMLWLWIQPIGVRADRKATPTPTSTPPPLIKNGSRDLPEVALTFDACPARGFDTGIVRVLTETQTPATFFLSGLWMKSHISDTQLLASIPYFELGEHSWNHPNFARLTARQIDDQISRTESLLTQLVGHSDKLLRFPYGSYSVRALQAIDRLGLTPVQWDVVSGDPSHSMTAKMIITRVLSQTQNGSIVIMHVNGRGWHTAEALPVVIAGLRERGFRLVTIGELLHDQATDVAH
jgi:peptidoglycan-N-acetylglucosamine deacetylase